GAVGARARDDGDGDRLGPGSPQLDVLVVTEHGPFARGSRQDEPVTAILGEPLRQLDGTVDVQAAVVVERRDHGGDDAAKSVCHASSLLSSDARSLPSVLKRSSCNSNHTVWYESISGLVNQSWSPASTRSTAVAR